MTINGIRYSLRAVFDAKGVGKSYVTNGGGRLVRVYEDADDSTLDSATYTDNDEHRDASYTLSSHLRWNGSSYSSAWVYLSDYTYSEIYQEVQTRTFKRDSLGRLLEEDHTMRRGT